MASEYIYLRRMSHRQPLEDGGRLEEGEPSVSDRQENHIDDLHGSHEFPRENTRVRNMLANECNGAHQKADKIGLHKGPLDLPVVDLTGAMNNKSLSQNEGTGRFDQRTEDIEFSVVFPQKDKSKGRRKKEAKDSDGDGGHRVNHEQGIQALAGGEVILKVSHSFRSVCAVMESCGGRQ